MPRGDAAARLVRVRVRGWGWLRVTRQLASHSPRSLLRSFARAAKAPGVRVSVQGSGFRLRGGVRFEFRLRARVRARVRVRGCESALRRVRRLECPRLRRLPRRLLRRRSRRRLLGLGLGLVLGPGLGLGRVRVRVSAAACSG
eukprot:scaffold31236_cov36-Phaeocystis_antarctica.AAC.1